MSAANRLRIDARSKRIASPGIVLYVIRQGLRVAAEKEKVGSRERSPNQSEPRLLWGRLN